MIQVSLIVKLMGQCFKVSMERQVSRQPVRCIFSVLLKQNIYDVCFKNDCFTKLGRIRPDSEFNINHL